MHEIDLDNSDIIQVPHDIHSSIHSILLVEDDQAFVNELTALLTEAIEVRFNLTHSSRLDTALEKLSNENYTIIIANISLPDIQGVEIYSALNAKAPHMPIIMMAEASEETTAVKAVQLGAQEYFIKHAIDADQLRGVIKYALEQNTVQQELNTMALIDQVTGLYNRPSFLTLAFHFLKIADRTKKGLIVLRLRLSNLYAIEEAYGTHGIKASLEATSRILKQTFRRSDIISRCTDDEFAVVALEAREKASAAILERLRQNMNAYNASCTEDMQIQLRIGIAHYNPEAPVSLAEIIAQTKRSQMNHPAGDIPDE